LIDLTVLCPPGPITQRDRDVFRAGAEYALAHVEASKDIILRERVRAVKKELKVLKEQS